MITGIDIVGRLPNRAPRTTIFLLYANTPTERRVLEAYVAELRADLPMDQQPHIAWMSDSKARDHFEHSKLAEALAVSASLDVIPIGVAWKPKTLAQQTWREIMSWMRVVESNRRQAGLLKRTPERCTVIIGEFGTKKALQARHRNIFDHLGLSYAPEANEFADYVALQAAMTIERDARPAMGQSVKYPRHVKAAIWGRPDFQAKLAQIAADESRKIESVQDEARACMKELIPRVSAPYVALSNVFSRTLCRLGYEQELVYAKEKMAEVRTLALTRPVALVWSHKTHIDGAAMLLASRQENFPFVHIVGGDNMAFFGLGYMMRRSGTVFIRRSIDSAVYKAVMRFYLAFLLEKRFPVSWALEGTRSRNGKLMPPRFGILKYVVEAADKAEMNDLHVVPVSIYYDLIAELGDYAREQVGAKKRKESLAWFLDYVRSLKKPLGRISLAVGEPVVVDTTSKQFEEAVGAGPQSFSVELQKLAFEASVNANAVTPVTPSSLICLALTGAAPQALTEEELTNAFWQLRNWAVARDLPLTNELEELDRERLAKIVSSMMDIGVLATYDEGPETVYSIGKDKHFEASYYRNNSIHFFVNKAIIEVALAKAKDAAQAEAMDTFWASALQLRDTFKFEFFYPGIETYRQEIEAELNRVESGWKAKLAAGGAGDLLDRMEPLVSHAVLRPFAEAYTVIADVLASKKSGSLKEKDVVAEALTLGRQSLLQRRIQSEESIGKLMFSNGFELAKNRGLVPDSKVDLKAARLSFVREMNDLIRFLREIELLAVKQRAEAGPENLLNANEPSPLTVVGEN